MTTDYPAIDVFELRALRAHEAVIIDCSFSLLDFDLGRRQYARGHIPGAHFLDMERDLAGAKGSHGGRHPLPDAEDFEVAMRRCGVRDDSLVVAYDRNRLAGAARLWWLMRYFGHRDTRVLDGGIDAWSRAGLPLSTQLPGSAQGDFTARPDPSLRVDTEYVRQAQSDAGIVLIDSRELARYQGREEPIDTVAGHVPGAECFPWTEVTDNDGRLKPRSFHAHRWRMLKPDKQAVVYCGSGITASVNILSMALAGVTDAKLYAGSWSDWISYSENPISIVASTTNN